MALFFSSTASQYMLATSGGATGYPYTITSWFTSNELTANKCLVGFAGTATAEYFSMNVTIAELGQHNAQAGGVVVSANTANAFTPKGWNFLAAMGYASNRRSVMLNGANTATNTTANSPSPVDGQIAIGTNPYGGATFLYTGFIGETAYWNVGLHENEVRWLAKGNSPLLLRHRLYYLKMYNPMKTPMPVAAPLPARANIIFQPINGPVAGLFDPHRRDPVPRSSIMLRFLGMFQQAVTTLVSLSLTVMGLSTLIKGVSNNERVTTTGVVSTTFSAGKLFSLSATGAPALVRQAGKVLALTVTSGLTLTRVKTTAVNLALTVISALAMVKQAATNLAVTTVGIVSEVFTAGKLLGFTVTSGLTISVLRVFLVNLSLTVTSALSIATQFIAAPVTAATGRLVGLIRGVGKIGRP